MRTAWLFAAVGCATAGHGGDDGVPPVGHCTSVDVLIVIDNSGTMTEEQADLVANLPGFVTRLDLSGLDYRIAVTSTGRDFAWDTLTPFGPAHATQTGDNGAFLAPAACGSSHPWVELGDPTPAPTLACLAAVGTKGPIYTMPLGAMRDALGKRVTDGTNAGFHRPGAVLDVVILTDRDDCSYEQTVALTGADVMCVSRAEPVATYLDFLDTFAGGRDMWSVSVLANPGPMTCTSAFGPAEAAPRLEDFVAQTAGTSALSSICDGHLATGLDAAVAHAVAQCQ